MIHELLPNIELMKRSKSSKRWLHEHFSDFYVKKAQEEGYRSRAIYKLKEVDEKERLLRPGMNIVDLGAAPGGWTQYITQQLQGHGRVVALDILPMDPFPDVTFIQGDFQDDETFTKLTAVVPEQSLDLLLSDMAPNMSGNAAIDIPKAMYLVELALDFAKTMLKPGGNVLIKIFHGAGFEELIKDTRKSFAKVSIKKPQASRSRSKETYLLAKGYGL